MSQVLFDDQDTVPVRCSVRDFVEFLLRSGDIDSRSARKDPDTMREGAEMHRRIQKEQGGAYAAEVPLSHTCLVTYGRFTFALTVEGRADGILTAPEGDYGVPAMEAVNLITDDKNALPFRRETVVIDEIKTMLRDVGRLTAPVPEHLAQAKCYAYFHCMKDELDEIAVRMTYVTLGNSRRNYFIGVYTKDELSEWYYALCREYARFEEWRLEHRSSRDAAIRAMEFPFEYRPGQDTLVKNVYRTILRERKLFLEAPTGVGKTISTVYPAVKSMGEGLTEKIFYLTAKTITRTVAEETFSLLTDRGLVFLPITITAKEKMCVLPKPDCNPESCPRAKGHFDRINEALYAMLSTLVEKNTFEQIEENSSAPDGETLSEGTPTAGAASLTTAPYTDAESTALRKGLLFSRDMILEYAERYQVCPYEMSLDLALFADAVICDYNYAFDPEVYFRRFFGGEVRRNYTMLIDEAHNLVERAREMYSAELVKEDFLAAKPEMAFYPPAVKALNACNRALLTIKQTHERFSVLELPDTVPMNLMRFCSAIDELVSERPASVPEFTTDLYFTARHFLAMYEQADDHYECYCDYLDDNRFLLRLQCMDPSRPLDERLSLCRSSILFSATLLPIRYYKDQLSGGPEDYAVYAESPFDPDNRLVLIADDVSTRYKRRTADEFRRIADYIADFCAAKPGNYMAFFPSYRYLTEIAMLLEDREDIRLLVQQNAMTEPEREEFLSAFSEDNEGTLLGLCVLGGIFSEGIDLTADRLIGAIIVGPGLPMVCNERELFRMYYAERCDAGFEYAYQYPGMNKVLQAAGRVIRTTEDVGAILLLDDRFLQSSYQSLFPREWGNCRRVSRDDMADVLRGFWDSKR
ncbi:MAG: ATP-dependent DNA helicase [Lachnospiraceae bacterium]|nr:ATP-dependent DNA helicase [Lachnospiraceae bacterium]